MKPDQTNSGHLYKSLVAGRGAWVGAEGSNSTPEMQDTGDEQRSPMAWGWVYSTYVCHFSSDTWKDGEGAEKAADAVPQG